ncbi:MAG: 16S rRNA (guanine(966)-N(2))-methyltransferase RsmD [Nitrospira sp.]|nr:16S rRNA (guanine(966)-N(2))-methyltransferase RsmD [Nitrospira sp.]
MRVIAGTHRGRRLRRPQGLAIRPTSDRVREALFSIIGNRLLNSRFLDLYAGTGAIGVEALSRGAAHVTCVESDAAALTLLRRNVEECKIANGMTIYAHPVEHFLQRPDRWGGPYQIIFADPPYMRTHEFIDLLTETMVNRFFTAETWLILEHANKTSVPSSLGSAIRTRHYRYGDTALSRYSIPDTKQR